MDITALQSLISTAASRSVPSSVGVQQGTDTTPTPATKDHYESKLAEIASKYDVRKISPKQMLAMADELYKNGLISGFEQGMIQMHYTKSTFDASNPNVFRPGELDQPDEPRDMLADFKYMASYQRTEDATKNVQHLVDELELIESSRRKSISSNSAATTQSSVNVHAAASSYSDAISKTTADAQSVVNVLEALASHSQNKSSAGNA